MQAKKIELIELIREIELIQLIQLVKVRDLGNPSCFNCTSQNVKEQNDTTIRVPTRPGKTWKNESTSGKPGNIMEF